MTIIFIILIALLLITSKICIKNNNLEYISKKQTTIINSMFLILVFYSHFFSYLNEVNQVDTYLKFIIQNVGQLMVTTFLFYSGYGIYESIKKNKEYKNNFFKKRFLPTFINFIIAIVLFIIVNILLGNKLNILKVFLSFTGYEAIGNSNWYMFAVFCEYIFLMISFKLFKKDKNVIHGVFLLSIFYIIVLSILKERHWYDTIMCFPVGMYFSYFKEKIEKYILNNKSYWVILVVTVLLFISLYILHRSISSVIIYNIVSSLFVFLMVLFSVKVKFNNKIFEYLGKRLFWIYILQRIPMMIFKGMFNYQLYFVICIIITLILTEIMYRFSNKLNRVLVR